MHFNASSFNRARACLCSVSHSSSGLLGVFNSQITEWRHLSGVITWRRLEMETLRAGMPPPCPPSNTHIQDSQWQILYPLWIQKWLYLFVFVHICVYVLHILCVSLFFFMSRALSCVNNNLMSVLCVMLAGLFPWSLRRVHCHHQACLIFQLRIRSLGTL